MRLLLITLIAGSMILLESCSNSNGEEPGIDCSLSDLAVSIDASAQPDCETEGSITLSATGGIEPYAFSINNVNFQTSGTFTGISAGNYTVTVQDADGCTSSQNFLLAAGPDGITLNVESTSSDCLSNTGTITVSASGGTDSFTYQLDGGTGQSAGDFTSVSPGSHTILVTDSEGCTAERNVVIATNTSLAANIMPIISANCAISGCHNGSVSPDLTRSSSVISNAGRIKSETQTGSMPRNGTLSQGQIDLIACWVDAGAQNN